MAALRAAIEGIKQRGNAELGDKTLLDALIPATDRLEQEFGGGASASDALAAAAATARESADATKPMLAKRGRAAYAGRAQPGLRGRRCGGDRGPVRARQQGVEPYHRLAPDHRVGGEP